MILKNFKTVILAFLVILLPQCHGNTKSLKANPSLSKAVTSTKSADKTIKITSIERSIHDVKIIMQQAKSLVESPDVPLCKAEIRVFKNNLLVDSLKFDEIEALGGCYGLLVYSQLVNNHLIISKYGDYDGRTIVINENGQIFSLIGGDVYFDKDSSLLFSIYDSDLFGFSVFDLKSDIELFKMEDMSARPINFYKNNNLFYIQTIDDETEELIIWEIEFDLKRILDVDIELESIKDLILPGFVDYSKIEINCE